MPRVTRNWKRELLLGAVSGELAAAVSLAAAELVAIAVGPQASPVTAIGGTAIDATPVEVKNWAIRHFGTSDKLVLQLGIVATLALFAAVVGVIAVRHRPAGVIGVALFGVVGAVAAVRRPVGVWTDAFPSLVGALAGAAVLWLLAGRIRGRGAPVQDDAGGPGEPAGAFDRRGFLIAASAAAAFSAVGGTVGRRLNTNNAAAVASRDAVRLPAPLSAAGRVPAGTDLRIPGMMPFTTPNASFYRVDTALTVPQVNADTWRLRIHGKGVSKPLEFTYQDLLRRPLVERDITLTCVSNEVGGPYVGNARWIGVPLAALLKEAGVRPPSAGGPADQLVARSVDGMTLGSPVETVLDGRDAMLAVGMNGEPLPFTHGFPVRMLVPGLYGYVSACKWLTDLELTTFADYDAYWVRRSWSPRAPIKTSSRIDTPRPFASLKAGPVPVAGVAWAQHRGVDKVEVRIDGGEWLAARPATEDTADTWRQWSYPWDAKPGSHRIEVRATDRTGQTQTEDRQGTVPNGSTGWHSVVVTVE
ncbi:molybdopterin-dependent oxidoreductase [Streptomyces sp. H39-S7]|uniref:molybdopterin-dependent oxidoreductase n=1 Tax=Streptomyces sp. H39-S7 TaxID=3004357 RepID=UPI003FA71E56